ncbi:DegT/DnrJ/EryC1/StrS family aminotransferase [Bacillus thuringiensis]|uniref:DegT/DnrJ/EryC1/StrS family aminotransferase n=1 Tax=Bacillus thuringiensis TaxID=1428 RepID=UPI003988792B
MKNTICAILGGEKAVKGKPFKWPPVENEEYAIVKELMDKSELSYYGREGKVLELEEDFKKYHEIEYALATSSGTAALHSAFVACDIGPEDEVIAPTHTFLATVTPIIATNGTPILVDCEYDTENIDPKGIEKAITNKTKAIVVTHLWGHPVEMDPILELAKKHNLKVIEDCSHAHGATYRGKKVGTLGDVACFSLQSKKIVSAGQGGMLITNNQEIYEKAVLFGHFRVRSEDSVVTPRLRQFCDTGYGLNYRMHSLAAAMAVVQFSKLDERIYNRQQRLDYFTKELNSIKGITPPVTRPYVTRGAFYGYKPRYKKEELGGLSHDMYLKALQAEGVKVKRTGSKPLHLSPIFSGINEGLKNFSASLPNSRTGYKSGDLPISEHIQSISLSLPTFTFEPYSLIDEYLEAFYKVSMQWEQLKYLEEKQNKELSIK